MRVVIATFMMITAITTLFPPLTAPVPVTLIVSLPCANLWFDYWIL